MFDGETDRPVHPDGDAARGLLSCGEGAPPSVRHPSVGRVVDGVVRRPVLVGQELWSP